MGLFNKKPRTVIVAKKGRKDFSSLQKAINKVPPGSRIILRPGIYNEWIEINKYIEIFGDGPREEIIIECVKKSHDLLRPMQAEIDKEIIGEDLEEYEEDIAYYSYDDFEYNQNSLNMLPEAYTQMKLGPLVEPLKAYWEGTLSQENFVTILKKRFKDETKNIDYILRNPSSLLKVIQSISKFPVGLLVSKGDLKISNCTIRGMGTIVKPDKKVELLDVGVSESLQPLDMDDHGSILVIAERKSKVEMSNCLLIGGSYAVKLYDSAIEISNSRLIDNNDSILCTNGNLRVINSEIYGGLGGIRTDNLYSIEVINSKMRNDINFFIRYGCERFLLKDTTLGASASNIDIDGGEIELTNCNFSIPKRAFIAKASNIKARDCNLLGVIFEDQEFYDNNQAEFLDGIYSAIYDDNVEKIIEFVSTSQDVLLQSLKNGMTPLQYAININKIESIKTLFKQGAILSDCTMEEPSFLHRAVILGNTELVALLITKDIDINVQDTDGLTPLDYALEKRKLDIARVLIENNVEVPLLDSLGVSIIHKCVKIAELPFLKTFVSRGLDLNIKDKSGFTPLEYALLNNEVETAKYLINNGSNCTVQDHIGTTVLHRAVLLNDFDLIKIILECGIKINVKDYMDCTPLYKAIQAKNLQMILYIVQLDENVRIWDKDGEIILILAIKTDSHELLKLLKLNKAITSDNIKWDDDPNQGNETSLNEKSYIFTCVKLLIERGITFSDLNSKLLNSAISTGNHELIEFLISNGIGPDSINDNDLTQLQYFASSHNNFDIDYVGMVKLLQSMGADINVKDKNGTTLLHWAVESLNIELTSYLLRNGLDPNATLYSRSETQHETKSEPESEPESIKYIYGLGSTRGTTPLDIFAYTLEPYGSYPSKVANTIVDMLVEYGFNISEGTIANYRRIEQLWDGSISYFLDSILKSQANVKIEYSYDTNDFTGIQLKGFFKGWPNPPSPEIHLKILKSSAFVILAIDSESGKVIGFINAISDGVLSAYIPLLEVLPAYKNRGIGSELVKRMLEKLNDYYMIDLTCDPELQSFYEKLGMKTSNGMMMRNYNRQSGE